MDMPRSAKDEAKAARYGRLLEYEDKSGINIIEKPISDDAEIYNG